jgi:RNA polymerase sigma-70 factor (ECF subfamily)
MFGEGAADQVHRALAEAMARERLRIVAALIRTTGDWELAEDAVNDAAERALRRWSADGIPDNPAAWLTTTARRRAIDLLRRRGNERSKLAQLDMKHNPDDEPAAAGHPIDDDRLRLMFTCCHPALSMEARVAVTLKVVSNLSTAAIGRVFLTSENTMGQRLLRAKQRIANAGIPYRVPPASALAERLDGVLAVIYLVFTAGYAASADDDLAAEGIRLGRLLVELMPDSDEARGLLALMLLHHARRDARLVEGELVTLEDQDRSRWDVDAISEALTLHPVVGAGRGPYRIQADLAAVHATALDAGSTDWLRIVALYDELLTVSPSPVVALNRSVAVGMSDGPLAGLHALDAIAAQLPDLHLVRAARGELLARAGRIAEARSELDQAIELAPSERERRQLSRRRAALPEA